MLCQTWTYSTCFVWYYCVDPEMIRQTFYKWYVHRNRSIVQYGFHSDLIKSIHKIISTEAEINAHTHTRIHAHKKKYYAQVIHFSWFVRYCLALLSAHEQFEIFFNFFFICLDNEQRCSNYALLYGFFQKI